MWEVTFKILLSILRFAGLAVNPVVFKKPPLQKGTLDNGKGPVGRTNQMQICLCFLLHLYYKKVYHLSRNHKLKQRRGQLLKLSLWKVLMSYLLLLLKSRSLGFMLCYQRQILSWTGNYWEN